MDGKKTRGRQKIEMKKIENDDDRMITFSKRRSGIYKKASELSILCGAETGVVIFSPTGKPFSFANPSMEAIARRFMMQTPAANNGTTHPLVEAHRQARINELTAKFNGLSAELEDEMQLRKSLTMQAKKVVNSSMSGWWEKPLEELELDDLNTACALTEELQKKLCSHLSQVRTMGSSSSTPMMDHAQANLNLSNV